MYTIQDTDKIFDINQFNALQEELHEKGILDSGEDTEMTASIKNLAAFREKLQDLKTETMPIPIASILIILCICVGIFFVSIRMTGWILTVLLMCYFIGRFIRSIWNRHYYIKYYHTQYKECEKILDEAIQNIQDDVRDFIKKMNPSTVDHVADLLTCNGASRAVASTLAQRLEDPKCKEFEYPE